MDFAESAQLRDRKESPVRQIERYAVTGGMARHLVELGHGNLARRVCDLVLDPRGPLHDDPRSILEQELRSPASYMTILTELARRPARTEHLTDALGLKASALWPLINVLQQMRLVRSILPVGAPQGARSTRHELSDGFYRFWFRFVFPNQSALEEELSPADLWNATIEPSLADFVAPAFEDLCRRFVRRQAGASAPTVGAWWGRALNSERRAGRRLTEEIDLVAARGSRVVNVGECKWTSKPMPILDQSNLDTTCTRAQMAAEKCPAGSIVGYATAWSPLLDKPAQGPVYLAANGGARPLPDIVAVLDGQVRVSLLGEVSTLVKGGKARLQNTFRVVPDAPVSRFVLTMLGGKERGLLVNSTDLCRNRERGVAVFRGHNGRVSRQALKIGLTFKGCNKVRRRAARKANARRAAARKASARRHR